MAEQILTFGPYGRQIMGSRADENFTGSARGASKTFAVIARMIERVANLPNYRGLFFRRSLKQLQELTLPEFKKIASLLGYDHHIRISDSIQNLKIECPSTGAKVSFSAAESPQDAGRFQGGNFHEITPDESQDMEPSVMEMIPAIARSTASDYLVSINWLANPNGPGHAWLRRRFIDPAKAISRHGNILHPDWTHPITGEQIPINGHWQYEKTVDVDGTEIRKQFNVWLIKTHLNPALDYREYIATLKMALADNPTLAAQWIGNDWDSLAGQFYSNIPVVDDVQVHPYDRILCAIDHGQRKTAAVWAAVSHSGEYRVFDCRMWHHVDVPDKGFGIVSQHPETGLYVIDPAARAMLEGSGARTIRRMYQDAGVTPLVLCKSNDRHAGWESVRTGFSSGKLVIDRRCRGLTESLASLVTKQGDSEDCDKTDGTDFQDDGDHYSDALRYLYVNGFYVGQDEEEYVRQETARSALQDPSLRRALDRSVTSSAYYR